MEGYPTHASLSDQTPRHPVLLTHGTGHMVVANARAMEEAGIRDDVGPTAGGEALRDAQGKLTGVFRENAADPLHEAFGRSQSRRSRDELRRDRLTAVRLATEECLANGVTSFQDAGASFASVDLFAELCERNELKVRLWVMLNEDNGALAKRLADYRRIGTGHEHLTVRAIKRLVDGALGTHGAWLLAPYADLPASTGLNTLEIASLRRTAQLGSNTAFRCACMPSATAPIAKCSTFMKRPRAAAI